MSPYGSDCLITPAGAVVLGVQSLRIPRTCSIGRARCLPWAFIPEARRASRSKPSRRRCSFAACDRTMVAKGVEGVSLDDQATRCVSCWCTWNTGSVASGVVHLRWRGSPRRSNPLRRQSPRSSAHRARACSGFPADCPHRSDCHCSSMSTLPSGCHTVSEYRRMLGCSSI